MGQSTAARLRASLLVEGGQINQEDVVTLGGGLDQIGLEAVQGVRPDRPGASAIKGQGDDSRRTETSTRARKQNTP